MGLILTILGKFCRQIEVEASRIGLAIPRHKSLTRNRWPWALTEGALEAGWAPTDTEYHWDDLFRILTGEEVELKDTGDIDSEAICEPFPLHDQ